MSRIDRGAVNVVKLPMEAYFILENGSNRYKFIQEIGRICNNSVTSFLMVMDRETYGLLYLRSSKYCYREFRFGDNCSDEEIAESLTRLMNGETIEAEDLNPRGEKIKICAGKPLSTIVDVQDYGDENVHVPYSGIYSDLMQCFNLNQIIPQNLFDGVKMQLSEKDLEVPKSDLEAMDRFAESQRLKLDYFESE